MPSPPWTPVFNGAVVDYLTMTFHQTPFIFSHFKRKRAQVCLRNMLLLRLGQTISVDDITCDLLPVHVNDHNIRSFASDGRDERQAFVYKDRNGGYTVTGILAVDMRKKVLKLARPLHKSIEKYDCDVFQFSEPAELLLTEVDDLRLFRKYYRHCFGGIAAC
jgi:hypothetical protein